MRSLNFFVLTITFIILAVILANAAYFWCALMLSCVFAAETIYKMGEGEKEGDERKR